MDGWCYRVVVVTGPVRLLLAFALLAAVHGPAILDGQQPRFGEHVEVARVVLDVRVLDDRVEPILGLTTEDFAVRIDGKPARVETVTWVGEQGAGADQTEPAVAPPSGAYPQRGRLIVFLFQKDLEPSRIVGLMQMLFKSRSFLKNLGPDDRVAVLSFDSHLEIWTDFTDDRERLNRILAHDVLFAERGAVQASPAPSLVERLDPGAGRRTYGIERALQLIGEALEPLQGSKSLVLVGHGFGRFSRGIVMMENDFAPACRALVAARTSVFSLDVTNADYHSLEAGLQLVSEESGGFYARTHIFPDLAMRRLSAALAGSYVLFVEKPDRYRAAHSIDVKLTRKKGRVLAATSYAEHVH